MGTAAFKVAVDNGSVASPHDLLIAQNDVKDGSGRLCGSEWHSVGGRFAWDLEENGSGEDAGRKVTLTQYARQRGAQRVLKLIDVADHCGAPILGGGRGERTTEV